VSDLRTSGQHRQVALVGAPSGVRRESMDVYARALFSALGDHPEWGWSPYQGPSARVAGVAVPRQLRMAAEWFASYVQQPRHVRRLHADVVHITDHSEAHLVRAASGPVIVTCHDLAPLEIPELIYRRTAGRLIGQRLFRFSVSSLAGAEAVIADSESTRDSILRMTDVRPERIHVVPLGVGSCFCPAPPGAVPAADNGPYILHVGAAGPAKNVSAVIKVLGLLNRNVGPVNLVRAGAHLPPDLVRQVHAAGLRDRVQDLGHVTTEHLVALYRGAVALIFPSFWEGFGLPVAEAMACGTPVIASNRASLVEVVGGASQSFEPNDVEGMAGAAALLLCDVSHRENARARCLRRGQELTWVATARKTARVYDAVRR
jgi:glycosyltransferase involved in cell wall biosynthesis